MNELRQLYQEVIIDHNRSPRNFYVMKDCTSYAKGHNPLCGDQLELYLKVVNDVIEEVSFVGKGCAISTASASLMTESLKGHTIQEAENIFHNFHHFLVSKDQESHPNLGKLTVLVGVKTFPSRIKCATLAWHTLEAALHTSSEVASTE